MPQGDSPDPRLVDPDSQAHWADPVSLGFCKDAFDRNTPGDRQMVAAPAMEQETSRIRSEYLG